MRTPRLATLACALALVAARGAAAQTDESPIIHFENGYQAGYSLAHSDVGSALDFAIAFGLSDKLQAQVAFVQGDAVFDSYRLLGLSYALSPKLGVTMEAGQGSATGAVAGLGLYATLLSRNLSGSLQTDLKLKLNYLAPVSGFSNGIVCFGLAVGVGI
jgi:hypothetical protein